MNKAHGQVHRLDGFRHIANRDVIHAGFRKGADIGKIDSAGGLELRPSATVAGISPIPLLIIHGDRDSTVPLHHGQQLYDLAREPKELWVVPDGGHIQAFERQIYRDRFVAYLTKVLSEPAAVHK